MRKLYFYSDFKEFKIAINGAGGQERWGSVVKIICSCMGPQFSFQHPHIVSHFPLLTVSKELVPSSGLHRSCMHMVHKGICWPNHRHTENEIKV